MLITGVRIRLCEANDQRLLAYCTIVLDNVFVVRDLKVIAGERNLMLSMPSKKVTDRCWRCRTRNHLRARFCNNCGDRLDEDRALRGAIGKAALYEDVAHPIHKATRHQIEVAVLQAYAHERFLSKQPGYVCRYDEVDWVENKVPAAPEATSSTSLQSA